MRNLSITARMLVVALAPAVLVASLLCLWFLLDGVRGVGRAEMARARTLAEGLALASEYGVATANEALLEDVARPALAIPSIVAVRFSGVAGETLKSFGEPAHRAEGLEGYWWAVLVDPVPLKEITQSVFRTDLSEFDEPLFADSDIAAAGGTEANDTAGRRLGTLHLTVDLAPAYHRQFDSVERALIGSAFVLLLATPAAVWLARGVSRPVREVTRSMDRLARHDYFGEMPVRTGGELGDLARGVLSLSTELSAFHTRLQESARVASDDLHVALDALERRNRELDEARAAAERASAFKSEFLANMSHEIRTPMNTVIGLLSTLTRTPLNPDQGEQVALINRASESLLALIDDILDITRIETGNLRIERVPCGLEEMLAELSHGVGAQAVERGVELCIAPLPPHVPRRILSDPLRLRQVMLNLLSNAIKFTAEGHVLLELSAQEMSDDRCTLVLSVTDTGIGIPVHLQERLFDAFEQADMSTTRLYGGAGLGLHICKGIVTLMGGGIVLESESGNGSRFDVTLPVTPLATEAAEPARSASLSLRYVDDYVPLEAANRRALALAGVRREPAESGVPSTVLVSVANRLLHEIDAGTPVGFGVPPAAHRRLALLTRITPDVRHWLRRVGFDGYVLRTPHIGELRRNLDLALADDPAVSLTSDAPRTSAGSDRERERSTPMIADERERARSVRPSAREDGPEARARVRVLAVDDQGMNLDLLGRYFIHLGVEGRFARTDEEVVRELAQERFDLILLDLHMPERDGFEIARELRDSDSLNRDTPLVALTADAYADSRTRALACGFDAVLTKPVTIDQVRAEIERRTAMGPLAAPVGSGAARVTAAKPRAVARGAVDAPMVSIAACAAGMLGNVEWATGAIATYREEIPQHVDTLNVTVARCDRRALFEAAHALKGVSDICRVTRVADAARTLEYAAEKGDWNRIGVLRDELVALLANAAEQCERELATTEGG